MAKYVCESVTRHVVTLNQCDVDTIINHTGVAEMVMGNGDVLQIRMEENVKIT